MKRLFDFDPAQYADTFATAGFVHIPKGLDQEFYKTLSKQVDRFLEGELLDQFALGNKQQSVYEFPDTAQNLDELFEAVGAVCGLNPKKLTLSERHIKFYESNANPNPAAHKDRFASQIAIGFSIQVPEGSKLVLYPYDHLEVNPFNASAGLRASLSPDRLPENILKSVRRVEISDAPGDITMFRGNKIWHLRANAAGTKMLYLKLNDCNCDVLGEDPSTAACRKFTEISLTSTDSDLEQMIPLIGRKVDYVERRYTRNWEEVAGVVLHGELSFTIDGEELLALRAMDGQRTVLSVVKEMGYSVDPTVGLQKIRRLAARGAVDLSNDRSLERILGKSLRPGEGQPLGSERLPMSPNFQ
jgi:hypothetical protein